MTEEAQAQGMFAEEVMKLNEARQSLAKKIQSVAQNGQLPPSVATSAGVMFQYFDTAYLWLTQVEQFIYMNSAENVDNVAGDALAKGNVSVVDGGK